jgi:hypothetical protein
MALLTAIFEENGIILTRLAVKKMKWQYASKRFYFGTNASI